MHAPSIKIAATGASIEVKTYGVTDAPLEANRTSGVNTNETSRIAPFVMGPMMIAIERAPQLRSATADATR